MDDQDATLSKVGFLIDNPSRMIHGRVFIEDLKAGALVFSVPVFEFLIEESLVKYLHFLYFSSPNVFHDFLNNQNLLKLHICKSN